MLRRNTPTFTVYHQGNPSSTLRLKAPSFDPKHSLAGQYIDFFPLEWTNFYTCKKPDGNFMALALKKPDGNLMALGLLLVCPELVYCVHRNPCFLVALKINCMRGRCTNCCPYGRVTLCEVCVTSPVRWRISSVCANTKVCFSLGHNYLLVKV